MPKSTLILKERNKDNPDISLLSSKRITNLVV